MESGCKKICGCWSLNATITLELQDVLQYKEAISYDYVRFNAMECDSKVEIQVGSFIKKKARHEHRPYS